MQQRGCFFQSDQFFTIKNIAAFQLVGYSVWIGEDAGSKRNEVEFMSTKIYRCAANNPVCYTWPVLLMVGYQAFDLKMPVRIRYGLQWFVGVTANIADCRSAATGSTPVQTAYGS